MSSAPPGVPADLQILLIGHLPALWHTDTHTGLFKNTQDVCVIPSSPWAVWLRNLSGELDLMMIFMGFSTRLHLEDADIYIFLFRMWKKVGMNKNELHGQSFYLCLILSATSPWSFMSSISHFQFEQNLLICSFLPANHYSFQTFEAFCRHQIELPWPSETFCCSHRNKSLQLAQWHLRLPCYPCFESPCYTRVNLAAVATWHVAAD